METRMQHPTGLNAMILLPLTVLSALSADGLTPAQANWFHAPGSAVTRHIGSAPGPTAQDIRAYRFLELGRGAPARSLSEGEKVRLRVSLAGNGRASDVSIERSSGMARLDDEAARFIKSHWRYRGGQAMPKSVLIEVGFARN
jgi:TonB family protein